MSSSTAEEFDIKVLDTVKKLGGKASTESVAIAMDASTDSVAAALWRLKTGDHPAKATFSS